MRFIQIRELSPAKLPWAFGLVLLLLIALGTNSYLGVRRILDDSDWVGQSYKIENELQTAFAELSSAEAWERGLLLGGDTINAQDYEESRQKATQLIENLKGRLVENTAQSNRQATMVKLYEEEFRHLDAALAGAMPTDITQFDSSQLSEERTRMARIRQLRDEMIEDEDLVLRKRIATQNATVAQVTTTFFLSGIITLALLGLLYSLVWQFFRAQVESQRVGEEHRIELQKRIAEKERAERELQRSNRELQDFAFVASHDLQEPLRKIQAFGDRIYTKNQGSLDEVSLDYLSRMQMAAARMQELIDALLNLSRITTKAQPFVRVDLQAVLKTVLEDLQRKIDEEGVVVTVGSLPYIEADPVQMRQLFQNLIANSSKFRKKTGQPRIDVKEVPSDDDSIVRLVVMDNGVGFDARHSEKIFVVFQRLYSRDEYPGSGIGLAICRRIVDRHGGRITADGTPGVGATFTIVLPRRQVESGS